MIHALLEIGLATQVVFPVHPRTRQRIASLGINMADKNVMLTEPLGYLDFLALEANASLVLTDSGGVQEETTYLGVPCLTVRPNTERPITLTVGTNQLVSNNREAIVASAQSAIMLDQHRSVLVRPELWDGFAARRIVNVLREMST
jgi:UDP-N-acetylglucosamine 2-epimerase (non-hydrolysing)